MTLKRCRVPKACIICGKPAGSREHIFPASLGGRRTSKQIYCGPHNQAFGSLAGIVAEQLKVINSLLSVRPDRADAAVPLLKSTRGGRVLEMAAGQARAVGTDPPSTENDPISMSFGGPEGLRAITYIALTFFAHHFQDLVRNDGFDEAKAFIQGADPNTFAWWESPAYTEKLPENLFRFGHTIIVGTNQAAGRASAVVSLFGTLTFGVDLGRVVGAPDRTVTVFLDPHADHPPNDIIEKVASVPLILSKPQPMQEHLRAAVQSGAGQRAMATLFECIERWGFDKRMEPVIVDLNAVRGDSKLLTEALVDLFESDAGPVFRLMEFVARDFRATATTSAKPIELAMSRTLDLMIAHDTSRASGLSEIAETVLAQAAAELIGALAREITKAPATPDLLWRLLSAGDGAAIVGKVMFDSLLQPPNA